MCGACGGSWELGMYGENSIGDKYLEIGKSIKL